jgi:hypothetical protein
MTLTDIKIVSHTGGRQSWGLLHWMVSFVDLDGVDATDHRFGQDEYLSQPFPIPHDVDLCINHDPLVAVLPGDVRHEEIP